jgi:DNA polymerase-3 subunit alpha
LTTDFVHLHNHGEQSILDGATKTIEIPKIAAALGQSAVALTDHGSLAGTLKFYLASLEAEVKHIFGVETYVTPDINWKDKDSPTWHLILLAMNRQGYENLNALSREAWTDGFYRKPRVDHTTLRKYNDGLIALSACMGGEFARAIETSGMDAGVEVAKAYRDIFGDRYYLESQPGNSADLNASIHTIGDDLNIPVTVTVDCHYDKAENADTAELLLVMQQAAGFKPKDKEFANLNSATASRMKSIMMRLNALWPERTLRFDKYKLHMMSREEVVTAMNAQGFFGNDLADSTLEIAERCEPVEIDTKTTYLPKMSDASETSDNKLARMVRLGLIDRGLWDKPEYVARAKEELGILKEKGFSDYFLIVEDIISEARRRNIYVGPGRGSAAGSLVAYALRITSRDPIQRKLMFFRFIDPSRDDFPDIDMDFEHRRRDEMKEYIREKYGEALSISTYTELQAKSLFKSISRALCIPLSEVEPITKHFTTLDEFESVAAARSSDGTSTYPKVAAFHLAHPEVLVEARKLEGHISAAGMHAAGIVVANRSMHEIVPIETRTDPQDKTKRVPVAAYDMNDVAKVGLIKLDFLGLDALTVIHDCVDLIKERHDVDIDWENFDTDDAYVLGELGRGNTVGVFQMESSPYRKLLSAMGVDTFEDLVASNALVRPGAFLTVAQDYIKRKKGKVKVEYPHESVVEELKDTYGVYIYQEQVMQMTMKLGGFSSAKANKLRKIIGKKLSPEEFAPYFGAWMENAGALIGPTKAEKIWHDFEKHSGYSFNRSHADCYSYIGYVTAWLKLYYPLEYLYALLKTEKKDTTRTTYLLEARRLGITILPPCVQRSQEEMSIDGEALRFGLSDVKSVGYAACQEIIDKRPYSGWSDFSERIVARKCNSRVVESLVAVDAFANVEGAPRHPNPEENYQSHLAFPIALESGDNLGIVFDNLEDYDEEEDFYTIKAVVKAIKRTETYVRVEMEDMTGNATVFAAMSCDLKEGEVLIGLIGERTLVGYTRPDGFIRQVERGTEGELTAFESYLMSTWDQHLTPLYDNGFGGFDADKVLAVPLQVREVTTKTGKKMCFAYLGDGVNVIKLTIFPQQWTSAKSKLSEWTPVCVKLAFTSDGSFTLAPGQSIISCDEVMTMLKDKK